MLEVIVHLKGGKICSIVKNFCHRKGDRAFSGVAKGYRFHGYEKQLRATKAGWDTESEASSSTPNTKEGSGSRTSAAVELVR
ncbi:uncharacterized protein PHALS_04475 [Plasmopara halstedii]|uniref:Uncharacterized protein n=1 Tax=Plasmopara halstedii TaxID=4781 RepID=A0A0P1A9K9_PLAHL|nr:uncharacterized protein PHALS_04475 [Plasmopara halstedii]CEG37009.1 hypothetical protein PHALS_04475 [Plasmopara halstedii]|eukprot:XP_024573378.1 hypothetical protein PHALS_04475 [Plasmopara halstedii]